MRQPTENGSNDEASHVTALDEHQIRIARERLKDLDQQARAFIREHPIATVFGAIAIGFLVGRVLR